MCSNSNLRSRHLPFLSYLPGIHRAYCSSSCCCECQRTRQPGCLLLRAHLDLPSSTFVGSSWPSQHSWFLLSVRSILDRWPFLAVLHSFSSNDQTLHPQHVTNAASFTGLWKLLKLVGWGQRWSAAEYCPCCRHHSMLSYLLGHLRTGLLRSKCKHFLG